MNLLFEIGCEEIPHTSVEQLSTQLYTNIANEFTKNNISYENIQKFSTPRRLSVLVQNLNSVIPSRKIVKRGPPLLAAIKNGKFTPSAQGFLANILKSVSLSESDIQPDNIPELIDIDNDYGAGFYKKKIDDKYFLVYFSQTEEITTKELLRDILPSVIEQFFCAHNMSWDTLDTKFIRPIRWIVALCDDEDGCDVVPFSYASIESGSVTYGHRFLADNAEIDLKDPRNYEQILKEHYVTVDSAKRRDIVISQLEVLEKEYNAEAVSKTKLTDIVNNLVEYPTLIVGSFDEKFLEIPIEILISEMVEHQKYFPLKNQKTGELLKYFVITSNVIEQEQVRLGNNKVIQARLNDGLFFYEQDTKAGIDSISENASKVIYHKDLGFYDEKIKRLNIISHLLNKKFNFVEESVLDTSIPLLKADLFSQVVYEFPELQGIIGEYYIKSAGYDDAIALSSKEHYYPKVSGGKLPSNSLAICVALADKLDDLLAFFLIGIIPTGSNDPYSLRRQTQGILRILIEKEIDLDLKNFVENIFSVYESFSQNSKITKNDFIKNVFDFIANRLKTTLKDYGFDGELVEAGISLFQWNVFILFQKLNALKNSLEQEYFQQFVNVYRRVSSILKKNKDISLIDQEINVDLLKNDFGKKLYDFHCSHKLRIIENINKNNFEQAYEDIAKYQKPLADFFENVFVDDEDLSLKKNRLILLKEIVDLLVDLPIVYK